MSKDVPNCPYCLSPAVPGTRVARVRRGRRVLSVEVRHWQCPGACPGPEGVPPFRFEDPELLRANDDAARRAWRERFGEEMPPARRPGRKPREKKTARIAVLFTESQRRQLDRARGAVSRSEYVRAAALSPLGSRRAPSFPLADCSEPDGRHREPA